MTNPKCGDPEITVIYTNHKGETRERRIIPQSIRFGFSHWHRQSQWLMQVFDVEKGQLREFAMRDIKFEAGMGMGIPVAASRSSALHDGGDKDCSSKCPACAERKQIHVAAASCDGLRIIEDPDNTGRVDLVNKQVADAITTANFVRFERDPNNGAGLWAVFLGDRPLHHFRPDQNVKEYMDHVRRNLQAYTDALQIPAQT